MNNTGIVLQLQREALDGSSDILNLLRKVRIISYKLGLEDLSTWVKNEVGGYTHGDPSERVPKYRHIAGGTIEFFNPSRGYSPTFIGDINIKRELEKVVISMGIPQITSYLNSNNTEFRYEFDPRIQKILNNESNTPVFLSFSIRYPISCLHQILEDVRNVVIDWTLLLESNGILGADLTFSEKEIGTAATATSIVNFITNIFNDSSDIQIQQNSKDAEQTVNSEKE